MGTRISPLMLFLTAMAPFSFVSAPADSATLAFDFEFNVPDFSKPELNPLEQLLTSNSIDRVVGKLAYDSNDAVFVTSNFVFASNIDFLFDQPPDELVFAPSGNLNQIRSWEVEISGVRYILELTGLDDTDLLLNQWFGGRIVGFPDNVFDLTDAGGGLTPQVVPTPAAMPLFLGGLGVLTALSLRQKSLKRVSAPKERRRR